MLEIALIIRRVMVLLKRQDTARRTHTIKYQLVIAVTEPKKKKNNNNDNSYFYVPALAQQATMHSCTRQKGRKDSDGRVQDVGLRIPECL